MDIIRLTFGDHRLISVLLNRLESRTIMESVIVVVIIVSQSSSTRKVESDQLVMSVNRVGEGS